MTEKAKSLETKILSVMEGNLENVNKYFNLLKETDSYEDWLELRCMNIQNFQIKKIQWMFSANTFYSFIWMTIITPYSDCDFEKWEEVSEFEDMKKFEAKPSKKSWFKRLLGL